MTNIIVDRLGNHCEISIMGHSGYAPRENDIVCAGVSTLAYTLLQGLYSMHERGDIETINHHEGDGELFVAYDVSPSCTDPDTALNLFLDGWAMLEEKFPQNVRLAVRSGENSVFEGGMLWL